MTNHVTDKPRLTGVVKSLIDEYINDNRKISFLHNGLSLVMATMKMSIQDIIYDGNNIFKVTLLINELEVHYSRNFTGIVKSPVKYIPNSFFDFYGFNLNKNIGAFIPGFCIELNFVDLTNLQYGR